MPWGIASSLSSLQVVSTADPAAGAEWTATVPAGKVWIVFSISVALVQGASQTPQPILIVDDGGTGVVYSSLGSSNAQAVSTTTRYTWAPGLTLSAQTGATTNVFATASLPAGLPLPAGYRVRSSTLGIGANSDYGAALLLVDQYG